MEVNPVVKNKEESVSVETFENVPIKDKSEDKEKNLTEESAKVQKEDKVSPKACIGLEKEEKPTTSKDEKESFEKKSTQQNQEELAKIRRRLKLLEKNYRKSK